MLLHLTNSVITIFFAGPGSPGWITITEQGIRQSFDLTRVMFCRGNISEKIRFGKLVQRGEIVLDLYSGIGYFTVPALVHGEAEYLYACEWNPNAVEALLFNLQDNGVSERATVYTGDCRVVAKENNLVNMFDRVSLGLIPSSEGGWRTAVRAIRDTTGGWLHVHANVPGKELGTWSVWLCCCLRDLMREEDKPGNWVVLCTHVEKVKSFAPTVNHYVADVFVGPADRVPFDVELKAGHAAVYHDNQRVEHCPASVTPSSCALSPEGVLHQSWMR
jgi:tRNA G37 N-methylase Trm5